MAKSLLEVKNLKKYFQIKKQGLFDKGASIKAVDDISFTIGEGETLGMVGESGSGKTTLVRAILGMVPRDRGTVRLGDDAIPTGLRGRGR